MTSIHIAPDGKKPLLAESVGWVGTVGLPGVLGFKPSGAGRERLEGWVGRVGRWAAPSW